MPTRLEIAYQVRQNLEDVAVTYFSTSDINDSIQDQYNRYAALTGGLIKAISIPFQTGTYWNLSQSIADYMYPVGLYSFRTNRWLEPKSRRFLDSIRLNWEQWQGEPNYFSPIDFRRICVAPYLTTASNTAILIYKSKPPVLTDGLVPRIPRQIEDILENGATADLLEQAKEYQKASTYWKEFNDTLRKAKNLVYEVTQADKLRVLQPYFPMGLYGPAGGESDMHIDNETPSGAINGVNTTFTLASAPNPPASLCLLLNGVTLFEGVGYTLSGNTIILGVAPKAPSEEDTQGDLLRAWYRVS